VAKGAYDPYLREERTRTGGVLYMLMIVIAVAFGGLVWQIYSGGGPAIPNIAAPATPYKHAPPAAAQAPDEAEQNAFFNSLDGQTDAPAPPVVSQHAAPRAQQAQTQTPPAPVSLSGMPNFEPNGPYVAQVAALQSQDAVQPAWQRLSSRAPNLFAHAQLDVQRADLGQRGLYFRVRAGYFADRANASLFCERIRQMGQDCIPVAR
jgi:hypothetical protein